MVIKVVDKGIVFMDAKNNTYIIQNRVLWTLSTKYGDIFYEETRQY